MTVRRRSHNALVFGAVLLVSILGVQLPARATTAPSLAGEQLYSVSEDTFSGTCDPNGNSVLTISNSGAPLKGNYRGFFTATINATIGPQIYPSPVNVNYTNLPVGHLLSFTESFTINTGTYTVTGTKNLVGRLSGLPDSFGVCVGSPGPNTFAMFANTNYSATVSGGTHYTGTTYFQAIPGYNANNEVVVVGFDEHFLTSTLVTDSIPPSIDLVAPPDGAAYTLGQQVTADYTCADEVGGSGVASCNGDAPAGQPIDTTTAGTHSFTVTASDYANNSASLTHEYTVVAGSISATVPDGGGTVTTDPGGIGATPDVPVQTSVQTTVGGAVAINAGQITDLPPSNYGFVGQQVTIDAPPAPDPQHPLVLTFSLDASLSPDPDTLQATRNDVLVAPCTGVAGTAEPDPCMTSPTLDQSTGDVSFTVYTTHASTWNFAVHAPYHFTGFFAPVDNEPTINVGKSGSAIPVKFSLGGNQGLAVFARGYPSSRQIACDTLAPVDAIEQTVTANSSGLTYDLTSAQYSYVWKTQTAWTGTCRRLKLKFGDGSAYSADFKFK